MLENLILSDRKNSELIKMMTWCGFADIKHLLTKIITKKREVLENRHENGIAVNLLSFSGLLIVYLHNAHCEFIVITAFKTVLLFTNTKIP